MVRIARNVSRKALPLAWWALAALFAVVFGFRLLRGLDLVGMGDWDYFTSWSLAEYRSIVEFHQWPSWSPWHCGGMPVAANFQSRVYSPTLLLVILFGPLAGGRIWVIVALCLGFEGTRRLALTLGAEPWGALFAALAVCANGGVFLRFAEGHLGDVPYLFVPWILLGLRRAWSHPASGALVGGIWGAFAWLEAGIYPLVYGLAIAGGWSAFEAARRRSIRPLLSMLGVSLAVALIAAPSLLPAASWLMEHARSAVSSERIPFAALYQIFFDRHPSLVIRPIVNNWGWWEYGTYLGWVFVAVLALALVRDLRRAPAWFVAGFLLFLMGLGDLGPWSPWTLLHHLPIIGSMRASGRVFQPMILCLALAVSLSLRHWGRLAPLVVIAFGTDLFLVGPPVLGEAFQRPFRPDPPGIFVQKDEPEAVLTLLREYYTSMSLRVAQDQGLISCYDPVPPEVAAADRRGGPEIVALSSEGIQPVQVETWTPNRLVLAVPSDLDASARIVVNQNHDPDWMVEGGSMEAPWQGLITVDPASGSSRIMLRHRNPLARLGVGLSAITLLGLAFLARREQS